jgi:hypothetical protein
LRETRLYGGQFGGIEPVADSDSEADVEAFAGLNGEVARGGFSAAFFNDSGGE